MLDDDGVCAALESAISLAAISSPTVQTITTMVVKAKTFMARMAKFGPEQAKKNLSEAAQQSVLAVSLSPPP